jgi:hypothetical protein
MQVLRHGQIPYFFPKARRLEVVIVDFFATEGRDEHEYHLLAPLDERRIQVTRSTELGGHHVALFERRIAFGFKVATSRFSGGIEVKVVPADEIGMIVSSRGNRPYFFQGGLEGVTPADFFPTEEQR